MPIRALYTIKDSPIPLIADMYKKIIVPSISEQSQQAFLEMIAPLSNGKPKRSVGNRAALYIVRTGDGNGQE